MQNAFKIVTVYSLERDSNSGIHAFFVMNFGRGSPLLRGCQRHLGGGDVREEEEGEEEEDEEEKEVVEEEDEEEEVVVVAEEEDEEEEEEVMGRGEQEEDYGTSGG